MPQSQIKDKYKLQVAIMLLPTGHHPARIAHCPYYPALVALDLGSDYYLD
jgi:hypothetical protein